jgi:hypothetical protein
MSGLDVAILGVSNVIEKESERIVKYKDLKVEVQRVLNIKTKVLPVIIGATRTFSESFRKYLRNIVGKHNIKELQRTATLGTAHVLRKVLVQEYMAFSMVHNITCTVKCK